MRHRGRTTVHLALTARRTVRVTNDDRVHTTYVDVRRVDGTPDDRWILEPGDSEILSLAPGQLDIALGPSAVMEDA